MVVRLTISKYLQEFLIAFTGTIPVRFPDRHYMNAHLRSLLVPVPHKINRPEPESIEVEIPRLSNFGRTKMFISKQGERTFENHVYSLFYASINLYIEAKKRDGKDRKKAILEFCDEYRIQSIDPDSIRKTLYRQTQPPKKTEKNKK